MPARAVDQTTNSEAFLQEHPDDLFHVRRGKATSSMRRIAGLARQRELGLSCLCLTRACPAGSSRPAPPGACTRCGFSRPSNKSGCVRPKSASAQRLLAPCLARAMPDWRSGWSCRPHLFPEQIRIVRLKRFVHGACQGWGQAKPSARVAWGWIECGSTAIDQDGLLARPAGGDHWGLGHGAAIRSCSGAAPEQRCRAPAIAQGSRVGNAPQPPQTQHVSGRRFARAPGFTRTDTSSDPSTWSDRRRSVRDGWSAGQADYWLVGDGFCGEDEAVATGGRCGREICSCAGGDPRAAPGPPGFQYSAFHADQGQALPLQPLPQGLSSEGEPPVVGMAKINGPPGGECCSRSWRQARRLQRPTDASTPASSR